MASELIGRTACPECGFHAAHVKIKTDKEGAHPYRHCPECGSQYFPRNKAQGDALRAKMRPEGQNIPPAAVAQSEPVPVKSDPVPAAPKTKMVFGVRVPA